MKDEQDKEHYSGPGIVFFQLNEKGQPRQFETQSQFQLSFNSFMKGPLEPHPEKLDFDAWGPHCSDIDIYHLILYSWKIGCSELNCRELDCRQRFSWAEQTMTPKRKILISQLLDKLIKIEITAMTTEYEKDKHWSHPEYTDLYKISQETLKMYNGIKTLTLFRTSTCSVNFQADSNNESWHTGLIYEIELNKSFDFGTKPVPMDQTGS